jgi:limonene-1,2-epoxide hydrolase
MEQFRNALESRDLDGLVAQFTDDVVFRSPAVYAPYQGRARVKVLLGAVGQVIEDFRGIRQIGAPDAADHALVFHARVGDREIEGCDFIHVNEDGLIDELYVMVRPLSGLMALAEAVQHQLGMTETGEAAETQGAEA